MCSHDIFFYDIPTFFSVVVFQKTRAGPRSILRAVGHRRLHWQLLGTLGHWRCSVAIPRHRAGLEGWKGWKMAPDGWFVMKYPIYMHIYTYICIYGYIYIHIYTYPYIHIYIHISTFVYIYISTSIYSYIISTSIYPHLYIRIYICISISIYIYIYPHLYIYIYITHMRIWPYMYVGK